jgi:hypothetical protein
MEQEPSRAAPALRIPTKIRKIFPRFPHESRTSTKTVARRGHGLRSAREYIEGPRALTSHGRRTTDGG